jgi:PHD/YefM family antitoxin component YafN of YafNO toxin-antitoxin module
MKIVQIAEAQATLAESVSDPMEKPVIITSEGQPNTALVTLENVDKEDNLALYPSKVD